MILTCLILITGSKTAQKLFNGIYKHPQDCLDQSDCKFVVKWTETKTAGIVQFTGFVKHSTMIQIGFSLLKKNVILTLQYNFLY